MKSDWLRQYRPAEQPRVRLVCLPHAGGSATWYLPLIRSLPPWVDVLAVQYPGRLDRLREPPLERIDDLARSTVEALSIVEDDVPLALFGHSMGAVVGYETTQLLEAAGRPVTHLFASARRAPSRYREDLVVSRLDDAGLMAHVQRLNGTAAAVFTNPDLAAVVLPALRGDYRAIDGYRHAPDRRVSCPVTALVGDSDPMTTLDEARDWASHTTGAFELTVLPGGHFYLTEQLGAVSEAVTRGLAG